MTLAPIAATELDHFQSFFREQYVAERMHADCLTRDEAEAFVTAQWRATLPRGTSTPNHHFFWGATPDGERIGLLWLHVDALHQLVFVYQILVFAPLRGRGHGRALLTAAEDFARQKAARAIALNVFTPNRTAIALYERAGFVAVSQHMAKVLERGAPR